MITLNPFFLTSETEYRLDNFPSKKKGYIITRSV